MRLSARASQRIGGAIAVCALLAGCSEPAPAVPTPSPSPVSSTPVETQLEKQTRLDFEAAEAAYRANMSEQERLFGSTSNSYSAAVLRKTSASEYLAFILRGLDEAKKDGWHTSKPTVIKRITPGSYSLNKLELYSCEDNRGVQLIYKSGKTVTPTDTRMLVQALTISRIQNAWKITDLASRQVKSFKGEARCGSA